MLFHFAKKNSRRRHPASPHTIGSQAVAQVWQQKTRPYLQRPGLQLIKQRLVVVRLWPFCHATNLPPTIAHILRNVRTTFQGRCLIRNVKSFALGAFRRVARIIVSVRKGDGCTKCRNSRCDK